MCYTSFLAHSKHELVKNSTTPRAFKQDKSEAWAGKHLSDQFHCDSKRCGLHVVSSGADQALYHRVVDTTEDRADSRPLVSRGSSLLSVKTQYAYLKVV
jgi:hypothetical protein